MLEDGDASAQGQSDCACILANLADNEACHKEIQASGAMTLLVTRGYAGNAALRREMGLASRGPPTGAIGMALGGERTGTTSPASFAGSCLRK